MAEDSTAPVEPVEDPIEDTLDEQPTDTAENTQQAQQPTDLAAQYAALEQRYREVQGWATRDAQARRKLEDTLLEERQQRSQPAPNPADPLAADRAALEAERRQAREERDWAEIQRTAPPEIINAYQEAQRAWALDPTPRGAIAGFQQGMMALAQSLAVKGQPAPKTPLPTRAEATAPRGVDASRSDAPDPGFDRTIAGAKTDHNLRQGVGAIFDQFFASRTPTDRR